MKKVLSLSFALLVLAGLPGCGGNKPVVKEEPETVEMQEERSQNIKQARTSGVLPKEVGWEEEDYC